MARKNNTDRPHTMMLQLELIGSCLEQLNREQCGDLLAGIYLYYLGEQPAFNDIETQVVFQFVKKAIDRDLDHWREYKAVKSKNTTNQWKEHNFNVFWNAYPCKDNEAEAREIFYALNAKQSEIINELKYEKEQNGEWLSGYIPPANEWLSDRGNANGWFD